VLKLALMKLFPFLVIVVLSNYCSATTPLLFKEGQGWLTNTSLRIDMEHLHNKQELKELRKQLRNNLTPAEAFLWNHLKGSKLGGRKFRRQSSIGKYVADFFSPSEQLIIELDGKAIKTILKELNIYNLWVSRY
jgi:hypothetical protein